jgi:hypothetical protein
LLLADSLHDAEKDVSHAGGFRHRLPFEFNRFNTQMLKQPDAAAEQDRHQIDLDFVKQPGLKTLLRDIRAADPDASASCDCLSLSDGALDAIRDERER